MSYFCFVSGDCNCTRHTSSPLHSNHSPPPSLWSLRLSGDERLAITRSNPHVSKDLLRPQLNRGDVGGLIRNLLLQFLKPGAWLINYGALILRRMPRLDVPSYRKRTCWASTRRDGTARAAGFGCRGTPSACGTRLSSVCWCPWACMTPNVSTPPFHEQMTPPTARPSDLDAWIQFLQFIKLLAGAGKRTHSGRSGLPVVPPSGSSTLPCRGSRSCTACNHRCSRGIVRRWRRRPTAEAQRRHQSPGPGGCCPGEAWCRWAPAGGICHIVSCCCRRGMSPMCPQADSMTSLLDLGGRINILRPSWCHDCRVVRLTLCEACGRIMELWGSSDWRLVERL